MLLNKRVFAVSVLATLITSNVNAAGFALIENGASGLGNAYAGASAVAEDASTTYFNPAGLSKLEGKHFLFAGHYISTKADLSNNGSTNAGGGTLSGANSDGGGGSFVPSFFYANKLNDKWTFGLGVTVPFGLGTEYDENWVGRYHAVKSEIKTLNINPSASFKVNEKFSVGFGVSVQRIEATLSNNIDSVATCRAITTVANCDSVGLTAVNIGNVSFDSKQSLTGDDWSFGWNFGLLYDISDKTRLGLAYRSQVAHTLEGDVDFTVNANLQAFLNAASSTFLSDTSVSTDLTVPESLSFSLSHNMNNKWQILADITWMKWERYNELVVDFANPVQPNSTSTPNYQNQLRYSVGATFKADSKKTYRMGLALDESAVRNADIRTARSPGNDRTWLSLGFGYQVSKTFGYDIGYTHLFISDTPINNTQAGKGTLTGSYDQSVDILSTQFNWKF